MRSPRPLNLLLSSTLLLSMACASDEDSVADASVGAESSGSTAADASSDSDDGDDLATTGGAGDASDSSETTSSEPRCGDGNVDEGEACDDGDRNGDYDACAADCSGPGSYCGDGIEDPREACDDGNAQNLDGCSAECLLPGTEVWVHDFGQSDEQWLDDIVISGIANGVVGGFDQVDTGGEATMLTSSVFRVDRQGVEEWRVPFAQAGWTLPNIEDLAVWDEGMKDHDIYVVGHFRDPRGVPTTVARWYALDGEVGSSLTNTLTTFNQIDLGPHGERAIGHRAAGSAPDRLYYYEDFLDPGYDWLFLNDDGGIHHQDIKVDPSTGDVIVLYADTNLDLLALLRYAANDGALVTGTVYEAGDGAVPTIGEEIVVTADGDIFVVGWATSISGSSSFLRKYDSDFNLVDAEFTIPNLIYRDVDVSTNGDVVVGGQFGFEYGSIHVYRALADGTLERSWEDTQLMGITSDVAFDKNGHVYRASSETGTVAMYAG